MAVPGGSGECAKRDGSEKAETDWSGTKQGPKHPVSGQNMAVPGGFRECAKRDGSGKAKTDWSGTKQGPKHLVFGFLLFCYFVLLLLQ